MNLRPPVIVGVVVIAGAVAALRSHATPPSPSFERTDAAPERRSRVERPRPSAPPVVVVYVAGAVARGGVYRLPAGARADDAVRAAGGANAAADLVAVNLAASLSDGDEVVVPEKGAPNDVVAGDDSATTTTSHRKRHHKKKRKKHHRVRHVSAPADDAATAADVAPAAGIDLNAADANALETLPGIGSSLAERIVTFRELNGPFAAHDDLLDVAGMTQKKLDTIEPFLR